MVESKFYERCGGQTPTFLLSLILKRRHNYIIIKRCFFKGLQKTSDLCLKNFYFLLVALGRLFSAPTVNNNKEMHSFMIVLYHLSLSSLTTSEYEHPYWYLYGEHKLYLTETIITRIRIFYFICTSLKQKAWKSLLYFFFLPVTQIKACTLSYIQQVTMLPSQSSRRISGCLMQF